MILPKLIALLRAQSLLKPMVPPGPLALLRAQALAKPVGLWQVMALLKPMALATPMPKRKRPTKTGGPLLIVSGLRITAGLWLLPLHSRR